jgi:malate dehydrogenase
MRDTVKLAVTRGGGRVARDLVPRIAAGEMFGPKRRVVLSLFDEPGNIPDAEATAARLRDHGHSTVDEVRVDADPLRAFAGADWILLLDDPRPRPGCVSPRDCADWRAFVGWGRAINAAAPNARILVDAYPSNIHAMIARAYAQDVPPWHWFAMTRHVEDCAADLVAARAGVARSSVSHLASFGCSGPPAFVDLRHARIDGHPAPAPIAGSEWAHGPFESALEGCIRDAIEGRSPASAVAGAIVATIHGLTNPTPYHHWISVGIESDGSYGVPRGLICGFPVRTEDGLSHSIIGGLPLDAHAQERIAQNVAELEFEAVSMSV